MKDEISILRRQAGITKQFDLRLAGFRLFIVYADHIESPLARRWKAAEILARDQFDLPALVAVDGGCSGLHIARGARLHLDKTEHIVVPSDQINFPAAAGRAEIARDHGIAEFSQMKVSRFFAAASGSVMGSEF